MGIALLSIADFFTPLQSLASRWMPARRSRRTASAGLRYVSVRPSCAVHPGASAQAEVPAPMRPLRVVRTVDAQQSGGRASRVLISGRMVDVCAELDRLAALEAADATPRAAGLH
ncbi:hypothetical protein [Variovorax sp. PBL-E5]|uniref:hypothetical protein n=1 Tax=Variovorax sp. PBL-E5 TaxID=434014 RepID=UPI0013A5B407|nr:hypothetical protein [Variovorax sp. PBL-E5]